MGKVYYHNLTKGWFNENDITDAAENSSAHDCIKLSFRGNALMIDLLKEDLEIGEKGEYDWARKEFLEAFQEVHGHAINPPIPSPKKLICHKTINYLQNGEYEYIEDIDELNKLYTLKVIEELAEVAASNYKDVDEFADLIKTVYAFAHANKIAPDMLSLAIIERAAIKGVMENAALINMNPSNPSNDLYFKSKTLLYGSDYFSIMAFSQPGKPK